ncbi:hypothetical protein EVAR_25975_1 [Eumeta japonica]|uniref:Uncharacterized protein n=1 Tax=Eumeta variegata TaxID=151549 RepID=A0A4C1V3F4_EUMVA|nr:hypothetical protein EVAR_25975_1 [Eumeta japonica]
MQNILQIASRNAHEILHEHLRIKGLASRRVSQNLTQAQKLIRLEWCRDMMIAKFKASSSRRFYDVIAGHSLRASKNTLRQGIMSIPRPALQQCEGLTLQECSVARILNCSGCGEVVEQLSLSRLLRMSTDGLEVSSIYLRLQTTRMVQFCAAPIGFN